MKKSLTEKIALVTGASRGLGAAIAEKLAAEGAKVAINYNTSHDLAATLVEKIQNKGGIAQKYNCDITDKNAVDKMIKNIGSDLGTIDVIVNNATGPQPFLKIEEQCWQDHLNQLDFFIKAPLYIVQAVLPSMKEQQTGSIINIGSEVVELGCPEFSHYVAAKAAMLGLTRSWAKELGPYGIRVNLIAPGFIPVERHQGVSQEAKDAYAQNVPLGHQGKPDDIASAVAFLASDEAKFVTGQKLAVNGGNTLC